MNKKSIVFGLALLACAIMAVALTACHHSAENDEQDAIEEEVVNLQPVTYPGRTIKYSQKFADLNEKHLEAAKQVGLSAPLSKREDVENKKNKLSKISTNSHYKVEELTHSSPYLTKNAALELEAICKDFQDILSRNGLPLYRPIVTSVLRTKEDVRNLQKRNSNSSSNSAHFYATTFDITYARYERISPEDGTYVPEDNLKLVLGQALLNEQRAGHIYVKYEINQGCFHITSRL